MKYLNLLPCKLCPSDNYLMQNLNEQQQDQIFMQLAFDPNFKNYIYSVFFHHLVNYVFYLF